MRLMSRVPCINTRKLVSTCSQRPLISRLPQTGAVRALHSTEYAVIKIGDTAGDGLGLWAAVVEKRGCGPGQASADTSPLRFLSACIQTSTVEGNLEKLLLQSRSYSNANNIFFYDDTLHIMNFSP